MNENPWVGVCRALMEVAQHHESPPDMVVCGVRLWKNSDGEACTTKVHEGNQFRLRLVSDNGYLTEWELEAHFADRVKSIRKRLRWSAGDTLLGYLPSVYKRMRFDAEQEQARIDSEVEARRAKVLAEREARGGVDYDYRTIRRES